MIPYFVNSNIPMGSTAGSNEYIEFTNKFVDVPTNVNVPPKIAA
jgi:hypothetical protein